MPPHACCLRVAPCLSRHFARLVRKGPCSLQSSDNVRVRGDETSVICRWMLCCVWRIWGQVRDSERDSDRLRDGSSYTAHSRWKYQQAACAVLMIQLYVLGSGSLRDGIFSECAILGACRRGSGNRQLPLRALPRHVRRTGQSAGSPATGGRAQRNCVKAVPEYGLSRPCRTLAWQDHTSGTARCLGAQLTATTWMGSASYRYALHPP